MGLRKLLLMGIAAAMLMVLTLGSASAIVFATFSQTSTGYPFSYDNATGNFSATSTVDFSFLALAPGSPFTVTGVTFAVSGFALTPVNTATSPFTQDWQITSFSFTKGGVNYLSGSATGTASVATGSNTGGVAGSEVKPIPDVIAYTSDLIPVFTPPLSYAWSIESPTNNPWGFVGANPDNFVDFTAAVNGSFSANAIPEPGAVGMLLGVGISGSLFAFRLRRRRA